MNTMKKTVFLLLIILSISTLKAQEETKSSFDIGVDFASRYVWRGLEFSDSPAIQPYAEYVSGDFTLGVWASYETGGQVVGQEFDFYASYSFGVVSIGFIDYAFPVDGASDGYFQLKNHIGEATLSFDGVEKFPMSIFLGVNIYNDESNSVYAEIGYPFTIGDTKLSAFIGAGNEMYAVANDFTVTNFGITASKDINVTPSFNIGTSASVIFNPDTEDAYLVFLISL